MDRAKDPIVSVRSVIVHPKNEKGDDRITLYIGGTEEGGRATTVEQFIQMIEAQKTNERGITLDLYIRDKEYQGRKFKSAFAFVKPTQAPPGGGGPRTFTQKTQPTEAELLAQIAALKAKAIA